MTIAHDTGRAPSGDVSLFYRRLGKPGNLPVLIVHGLSYFSYDWLDVAQALAVDREVVCMDMRGFGDSDWSAGKDYSVPAMGGDIVNLLDHLRWPGCALVGHSMAGRASSFVAAKNPARIAGLALIDFSPEVAPAGGRRVATIVGGTPDVFASMDEALRYFGHSDRARYEAYLKPVAGGFILKRDTFFRDQFRRILETGERPKLGVDMWQLIAEVECPILSMRGTRSDMYTADAAAKMAKANARLEVVAIDAGHDIAGENPQGFLAAMRPFLSRLDATR